MVFLTANSFWNLRHFRKPLAEALEANGYEVVGVAPGPLPAEVPGYFARFIPLRRLRAHSQNPIRDWRFVRELVRIYRREKPELAFHFTIKPNTWGAIAARMSGVPMVAVITGLGFAFLHPKGLLRLVPALYRFSLKKAKAVVFQNEDDRDLFLARGLIRPGQERLIRGSGVDTRYFCPEPIPPNDHFVFVYIGRLLRDKGLETLLQAWDIAHGDMPGAVLWIGGTAEEANPAATPRSTHPRVSWLGQMDDVRPFLVRCNVLVLPSLREGTPMSVLEALSMERPVITTNVAGCRQTIEPGVNGWLTPPADAESLAAALTEAYHCDPAQLQAMGRAGREKMIREFAAPVVARQFLELTREILHEKRSG